MGAVNITKFANCDRAAAAVRRGTAVPAVGLAGILPAAREKAGGTPAGPTGRMPVPHSAVCPYELPVAIGAGL